MVGIHSLYNARVAQVSSVVCFQMHFRKSSSHRGRTCRTAEVAQSAHARTDCLLIGQVRLWPIASLATARDAAFPAAHDLGARFQDHVEGRLGRTAHAAETTRCDDLAQLGLAGLGSERRADLLRA